MIHRMVSIAIASSNSSGRCSRTEAADAGAPPFPRLFALGADGPGRDVSHQVAICWDLPWWSLVDSHGWVFKSWEIATSNLWSTAAWLRIILTHIQPCNLRWVTAGSRGCLPPPACCHSPPDAKCGSSNGSIRLPIVVESSASIQDIKLGCTNGGWLVVIMMVNNY